MRYAHTLLFVCPDCNLPVAVSRISQYESLEEVENMLVRIRCDYCLNAFEIRAVMSQTHWVTRWEEMAVKRAAS